MGFRFYRRIQIVPGVRLNFGTRGVSASFGHRGAWLTVGQHGRRRATLGFPGSGLYYTQQVGSGSSSARPAKAPSALRTLGIILLVIFFGPWIVGGIIAAFWPH